MCAGAAGLACAVAGEAAGRPWAEMLAAVGCGVQSLLQGRGHKDLKNPPSFVVTYPQAGALVGKISEPTDNLEQAPSSVS